MIVDCMTCPVRGRRCDSCAVTALGAAELHLDAAENRVVSIFVGAGLVSPAAVSKLHARPEGLQHRGTVRAVG